MSHIISDFLDAPALFQLHKLRFTSGRRIQLYRAIIQLQKTDVPLFRALKTMHESYSQKGRYPHNVMAMVIDDAIKALSAGSKTLTAAIRHWLPNDEATQLVAGEEAGRLVPALESIIKLIQTKNQMWEVLGEKMAEPALLLALAVNVLYRIMDKVVPAASRTHDLSQSTGSAWAVYTMSKIVNDYGVALLVVPLAIVVLIAWSLPRGGWHDIRLLLERLPPWSIYKTLTGASFLLNVAVMLRSGVPLYNALDLIRQNASPWLKERVELTMFGLRQGLNLGQALANTELDFPHKRALPFLIVLSEQKGFEDTIAVYADEWVEDALRDVKKSLGATKVVLLVVLAMGAGVTFSGMLAMGGLPN